jgi:hypothetical protein
MALIDPDEEDHAEAPDRMEKTVYKCGCEVSDFQGDAPEKCPRHGQEIARVIPAQ